MLYRHTTPRTRRFTVFGGGISPRLALCLMLEPLFAACQRPGFATTSHPARTGKIEETGRKRTEDCDCFVQSFKRCPSQLASRSELFVL